MAKQSRAATVSARMASLARVHADLVWRIDQVLLHGRGDATKLPMMLARRDAIIAECRNLHQAERRAAAFDQDRAIADLTAMLDDELA